MMTDDLGAVLDRSWGTGGPRASSADPSCRWCGKSRSEGHAEDCPCVALDLALRQRDALADYVKAEKRMVIMQGAFHLAKKPAKADVKRRLDEAALLLEARLRRLSDLGIEEMVR
jgi:hypothetical protein